MLSRLGSISLVALLSLTTDTYTPVSKIPLEGGSFETDNLQNVYTFHGNTLKKYNSSGKLLFTYSDKSYGSITSVDTYDPMKLLVFFKDFPEIVLLDNTLSLNGNPFSPSDAGFPQATLVCASHDNGIWLYDAQNFQLVRLDVNLNVVQKTGNIAQPLGLYLNPDYMVEYNNFLYVNDSANGILVFDSFGAYYKTVEVKGLTTFDLNSDVLYYTAHNRIHAFQLKTLIDDIAKAPDTLASYVRVEKNMLYEKFNDSVRVFTIK